MTAEQCNEAVKKLMLLRNEIRKLPLRSIQYDVMLLEIAGLDAAIKLHDASMPTYSRHTKLN